jgi:dihydrofolate synthase / folylpolyglutamate synthase
MQINQEYQAALDYLYSFVDYSLTRGFLFSPEKFDLGRMVALMESLGNPHQHYPLIHVAGTKGKGSVSAMCANVLRVAGYKTGFYSSPHLHDYVERIQINGQPIAHVELVELVEEIKPKVAAIPALTTFEITTALAFWYFARHDVMAAVIEVGLGGRLDATNIVNPLVSVITSLSYDHMNVLGNTLAEIAGEKGGIIKAQIPVVVAPQPAEACEVLERLAAERLSPYIQVGEEFRFEELSHSTESGQVFNIWRAEDTPGIERVPVQDRPIQGSKVQLTIPLLGSHQVQNAAVAYAALQVAGGRGLPVSAEAIQEGFKTVQWPGRFEILRKDPPIIIDSAHNGDSAQKLRKTLDDYFPGRPVILIFGASDDKDITGMFSELLPRVSQLIVTRSFHPRAMDPETLLELARDFGKPVRLVEKVEDALAAALPAAQNDTIILATGSLFIASAVRETWLNHQAAGQV